MPSRPAGTTWHEQGNMSQDQKMTDVVLTKTAASLLGTVLTIWNGNRAKAADDARARRRSAADELWAAIDHLQVTIQKADSSTDPVLLAAAIDRVYAAFRSSEGVRPRGFRHLQRSVRDSVGEAIGGAVWIDYRDICEHEPVTYDRMWAQYAAEYLSLMCDRVGTWRALYSESKAAKVTLPDYNTWLLDTDRWSPPYALSTRR